jgi:N-acetyl-alpha-D-muramate 1-phosphate uridylyltransferase
VTEDVHPRPATANPPGQPDPPELCAVVLAAGQGLGLRPLTLLRPKPLCPVDNVALIDHGVERARTVTTDVAVNLHHGRAALEEHLAHHDLTGAMSTGGLHVVVEEPEALGTAGALGNLRSWIDGRGVLVLNGDTWCPGSLAPLAARWDRERVAIVVVGDDTLHGVSRIAAAFMPWSEVRMLEAEPSGLWEVSWRRLLADGAIVVFRWDGPCIDCGTAARYLRANLTASGGASVVGHGAVVDGAIERSVVWDGAYVAVGEHLLKAIRADGQTVLVR